MAMGQSVPYRTDAHVIRLATDQVGCQTGDLPRTLSEISRP
jgi:hypothetical protein